MGNRNSRYLNGLVSFINDTKPFHSKLTEIQQIYHFSDEMHVQMSESNRFNIVFNSFWGSEYFSDGRTTTPSGTNRIQKINFTNTPLFRNESDSVFVVGSDELQSIPGVPQLYDQANLSLADSVITRMVKTYPMHQGIDYHLSYGAHSFRIKQTGRTGFSEIVGTRSLTITPNDLTLPAIIPIDIPGAETLHIRSGMAEVISNTFIKVLAYGTIVIDGSASKSYYPLVSNITEENLLAEATAATQLLAMDKSSPSSSYNRLKSIFNEIEIVATANNNLAAITALTALRTELELRIPKSFESLINSLISGNTPVIQGFVAWRGTDVTKPYDDRYVENELYSHSPNILANAFTDIGQWDYCGLQYDDVDAASFSIKNIVSNPYVEDYEEWTLTAFDSDTLIVHGSLSGNIGTVQLGARFKSVPISFSVIKIKNELTIGDVAVITPKNQITVHASAPHETWSIIKTDPFGYTRPVIFSTNYANLKDKNGNLGRVSILNRTVKTGTVTIKPDGTGGLTVKHSTDTRINGTAKFGVLYNDGFIAFKASHGTTFQMRDDEEFVVDITNIPPFAEELSLVYSYDHDGFDAQSSVYNTVDDPYKVYLSNFEYGFDGVQKFEGGSFDENAKNTSISDGHNYVQDYLRRLEFGFDSRFVGYDFNSFGLKYLSDAPLDGRMWRLRAKIDQEKPMKLHAFTPSNKFNLISSDNTGNPYAPGIFDAQNTVTSDGIQSANDPDTEPDLYLYYASEFILEYFNTTSNVWVTVDQNVPIGELYTNTSQSIQFTIVEASKPFIAAELHSSWVNLDGSIGSEITYGGDCITWTTRNPDPVVDCVELISPRVPRVLMHPSGFSETQNFHCLMKFSSPNTYQLRFDGYGDNLNNISRINIDMRTNGNSYQHKQNSIHYTLIPNEYGFANGDVIRFDTSSSRPNYLVHGSVSGWQKPAEFNKYYWNGKIGFKISEPQFTFYEDNVVVEGDRKWKTVDGEFAVTWYNHTITDISYFISYNNSDNWVLARDGEVVACGTSVLDDGNIRITVPDKKILTSNIRIDVNSDDFNYAFGQSSVLFKSTGHRQLITGDMLAIRRARSEKLHVHLDTARIDITSLNPMPMPIWAYDLKTRQEPNYKLEDFSPEVNYYHNWLPVNRTGYDYGNSIATYTDHANSISISSAANNVKFGNLTSNGDFSFEPNFISKYLPLNTSMFFLTEQGGFNEQVKVHMYEDVKFFVSGNSAFDVMFSDKFSVSLSDGIGFKIKSQYDSDLTVSMSDINFTGFMPGFDNLPFELEEETHTTVTLPGDETVGGGGTIDVITQDGYFDPGIPLTSFFETAKKLLLKADRNENEERLLGVLLSAINPWVNANNLTDFSINDFIGLMNENPPSDEFIARLVNITNTLSFGIPIEGVGIDITDYNTSDVGTLFKETVLMSMRDAGGFNVLSMDYTPFDLESKSSTVVIIDEFKQPPQLASFSSFDHNVILSTKGDVTVSSSFEMNGCSIVIWSEQWTAPKLITPISRTKNSISFSLPSLTTCKLAVVTTT